MNKTILSLLTALFTLAVTKNALACGSSTPTFLDFGGSIMSPAVSLILLLTITLGLSEFEKFKIKYFWLGIGAYLLFSIPFIAVNYAYFEYNKKFIPAIVCMAISFRIFTAFSFIIFALSFKVEKLKKYKEISAYFLFAPLMLIFMYMGVKATGIFTYAGGTLVGC